MNNKCRTELRRILENKRQELAEKIKQKKYELGIEKKSSKSQNYGVDTDYIFESVQSEMDAFLVQRQSDELYRVKDALERLEKGAYGICEECGEKISIKRLQAIPFAIQCKTCKEGRDNNS